MATRLFKNAYVFLYLIAKMNKYAKSTSGGVLLFGIIDSYVLGLWMGIPQGGADL